MVRFAREAPPGDRRRGPEVGAAGAQPYPPAGPARDLHRAAAMGDLAMAMAVLAEHPLQVSSQAHFKITPLHRAAAGGHADIIDLLLDGGAGVDARDHGGRTPLHLAAEHGHVAAATALIARGARLDRMDQGGDTPLHKAARQGRGGLVRLLLAERADPNARGDCGGAPLHAAARGGSRDVVQALLAGGALANAQSTAHPSRWTPLDEALQAGHGELVDLLTEHGGADPAKGPIGVDRAAAMGYIARLRVLLDRDPELIASRDIVHRRTALHWAAANGQVAAAELLLSRNADVRALDKRGKTPADLAAAAGFDALAELLRRSGPA